MITENSDKRELLTAIDEAVSGLQELMSSLEENLVNTVPYKDSWTAGQLFRHVAKSTKGIARIMRTDGTPAERDAGERIPELKKSFLNFSIKMQSPEFIIPETGPYEKGAIIEEMNKSFKLLQESTNTANLSGLVDGLPLGAITKLEAIHFVLYHTQRHLHQMKKICDAVKTK